MVNEAPAYGVTRRGVERDGFRRLAASLSLLAAVVLPGFAADLTAAAQGKADSETDAVRALWQAGVARADITPAESIWLAGYAARRQPSQGVALPIHVKALALDPPDGDPLVLLTADLITMPRGVAEEVAGQIRHRFKLPRERILLAASHSHSSPVVEDRLLGMYRLSEIDRKKVGAYTRSVEAKLFSVAVQALESLQPASLSYGHGQAGFGENRRKVNSNDPVDHDVPVLLVDFSPSHPTRNNAQRRAVVFAYACHNTTLDGYQVCGDYAGCAQAHLQETHPGLTALFVSGCGADINPHPRRSMALARAHGEELARAVSRVLSGPLTSIDSSAGAAFGYAHLPLAPVPRRSELTRQLHDENVYVRKRARQLLQQLNSGRGIADSYPLPLQVWRLGSNPERAFRIVAIAGEVVVDYALRLKRELGEKGLLVAGYTNDCPGYIPSERVLKEGGYEGGDAMLYFGVHGSWLPGVENRVIRLVHELLHTAGAP